MIFLVIVLTVVIVWLLATQNNSIGSSSNKNIGTPQQAADSDNTAANNNNSSGSGRHISLLHPEFGTEKMEKVSVQDRGKAVEEKVKNIISIDIAILDFISKLPDLIVTNSFQLPQNADVHD
ncbi:unnamed protein product [Ceratitis capitata]|uniref:(Mediterranean fruit fly) hypothetical protein n=1 Tax=Ceratitis capitata TaxID=7213 RepID=A0A811U872_CERCA|nr:unnamed protein product [Ceratitis capitata]